MRIVDFMYGRIFEVNTLFNTWKIVGNDINSQLAKETNMRDTELLD